MSRTVKASELQVGDVMALGTVKEVERGTQRFDGQMMHAIRVTYVPSTQDALRGVTKRITSFRASQPVLVTA